MFNKQRTGLKYICENRIFKAIEVFSLKLECVFYSVVFYSNILFFINSLFYLYSNDK